MLLRWPMHPHRRTVLLAIDLLVLAVVLALYALLVMNRQGSSQSMAMQSSAVARKLRPRFLPISGVLSDGRELSGTVYPSLPGPNTLHLDLRGTPQPSSWMRHLDLIVTMPGMHMLPVRVRLTAQHSGYSGSVRLPMFGFYQARVSLGAPTASVSGTMRIALLLPRM